MAARRRAQTRERIVRWVVIAGIAVFSVWFLFIRGQAPDAIAGYEVEHFSLTGGGDHTETVVSYESSPPVSGPHSQRGSDCGTHANQLANENLVHTLEHGAVAIFYLPTTEPEEIERVEALVQSYDSHTFSAPYTEMDSPIVVAAWGHMMRLEEFDEPAAREFIEEFRQGGDSPEAFQDCPNTAQQSAAATPTPIPVPSGSVIEEADDRGGQDRGKGSGGGNSGKSGGDGDGDKGKD